VRWLFWLSALYVVYVYAGYPLLLMAWAKLARRRAATDTFAPGRWPTVSIIVAARNEGHRLRTRLENLRELDYPGPRPEIVVASDGSTDHTEWIVRASDADADFVSLPPGGKAVALNAAVAASHGEILVFADARQTFDANAARFLIAPFADPGIGAVSGELVLGCEEAAGRRKRLDRRVLQMAFDRYNRRVSDRRRDQASGVGEGVRRYWEYEKELRRLESRVRSMVGATGAIYAMRRSLWKPLPEGTILDDVLAPMRAVLAGSRIVFEPRAQAYDHTAADAATESRRKIRTLAGNFQILWREPRLLLPFVNPVWLQYVSHKIGRLLVPYALLAILVSSIALADEHPLYLAALLAQIGFYVEAVYGWWLTHRQPPGPRTLAQKAGTIAFAFMVLNASAVAGLGAAMLGRRVWR
jgi:cellulose synthase/poly-beta-1,6-N-acetylglucosamine synthase-like glycosyltransferase